MKYKRKSGSIDLDYRYYLTQEGIFHAVFGHKLTVKERRKSNYIWESLLKQYPERVELEKQFLKEQANLMIYPD